MDLDASLHRAILVERAVGLDLLRQASRDPAKLSAAAETDSGSLLAPALQRLTGSLVGRPFWQIQQTWYLDHMDDFLATAARPYRETASRIPRVARAPWDLSLIVIPVYTGILRHRDAAKANLALLQTGLLLDDCRAARGAYPATLEGLGTTAPPDPFSGRPLVYRRQGAGYLLYSVGGNLTDDGGKPAEDKAERLQEGDLVWGAGVGK